jgi:methylenetetrahydrofolate reductase (NADPH)
MEETNQESNTPEAPKKPGNRFRDAMILRDKFVYTVELVPSRGSRGKAHDQVLELAQRAAASGLIHALSITDNPGGHPALAPEVIGFEIRQLGMDPIIHFTCKDKSRNQIESTLYAFDRIGLRNILAMTGDYPLYGFEGKSKPVFDLDSVQLLHLVSQMNEGLEINGRAPGGGTKLPPIKMFKGCAVSPFKQLESETMTQYYKLWNKVKAGADFIVTQVGYDARKFDELLRYMRHSNIMVPILGNVYVLNLGAARVMNRKAIPGCVVTDELFRKYEEESTSPDKGKGERLLRAAKLIAILRGIGYDGAHIGGPNLKYEDIEWVILKSEELFKEWPSLVQEFNYPQQDGFYLFEKDSATGLNTDNLSAHKSHAGKSLAYRLMRIFHNYVFGKEAPLYSTACALYKAIEGTRLEGLFGDVEFLIKFITSRCRKCGDCTLPELAFLCPQSQCPKFLFNGQCGGSVEGWCEVFPGKRKCVYVRAYDRLKSYGEEESLKGEYIRPRNWELDQSSSWANYFLGRDHAAAKCNQNSSEL